MKYRNKKWLEHKYWNEELNTREIASLCGVGKTTIKSWMKRLGIPRRSRSIAAKKSWNDERRIAFSLEVKRRWKNNVYDEEWLKKNAETTKKSWSEGVYDNIWDENTRLKVSKAARARWENNDEERKEFSERMKRAWEKGDYSRQHSIESRKKMVVARKKAWEQGIYDNVHTKEWRVQKSEAIKAAYARGAYDDPEYRRKLSEKKKGDWKNGVYDNVFQSPTAIEIEVSKALDAVHILHEVQYRPDRCSYTFDEFIPPNILVEIHGDYWHGPKRPKQQKKDAKKAKWAAENDYTLVVIWEQEIKELGAWPLLRNRLPGIFV